MKILNVMRTMDPRIGGPASGINALSVGFRHWASSNDVVALDDPNAPWVRNSPSNIIALGAARGAYGYSNKLLTWLKDHHREYDAVFGHGAWVFSSLACWLTLRKLDLPYFVVPHGSLDPWFADAFPFKQPKKLLYWKLFASKVVRDAAGVVFTTQDEADRARGAFHPYNVREIVVKYGVPDAPDTFQSASRAFKNKFPNLDGKRLLLFMSRLVKQKGVDIVLDAFANVARSHPDLHLAIAGPDQIGMQADLVRRAESLGIAPRVSWLGSLSGDLKWGAFHCAEVFVLPSHMENFGIVVAEALSCGLPVLISDKVQIWREIQARGAGLVADDSTQGMTSLLNQWLAMDPRLRQDMRAAARDCFLAEFHAIAAARSWLDAVENSGRLELTH